MARIEEARPLLDVPELARRDSGPSSTVRASTRPKAVSWAFLGFSPSAIRIRINNQEGQEGPGEIQLAVTRDLEYWERPFRVPCVPRGRLGEWDPGFFVTASGALRVGDEIWLYYGGSNYTHGTPCLYLPNDPKRKTVYTGSIGLAIWPLDRFVSVDAGAEGGRLTTVPLAFTATGSN